MLLFMVLLTNDGFCRDMGAIPGGIDSFFFRMRYISEKRSCSDSLTYTIDGKGNITGRIFFNPSLPNLPANGAKNIYFLRLIVDFMGFLGVEKAFVVTHNCCYVLTGFPECDKM